MVKFLATQALTTLCALLRTFTSKPDQSLRLVALQWPGQSLTGLGITDSQTLYVQSSSKD